MPLYHHPVQSGAVLGVQNGKSLKISDEQICYWFIMAQVEMRCRLVFRTRLGVVGGDSDP